MLIADEAGVEGDVDSRDFAMGVADFQTPVPWHEDGPVGVGEVEGFGFGIARVHGEGESGVIELELFELDDAAGEFGVVEAEDDAFQPGNFSQVFGFGIDPDVGGDDSAQDDVAQTADFEMHSLFCDFTFDGGAPRLRQTGIIRPP